MVFCTLCLLKHAPILVSNTIDTSLLRCPYPCTYRPVLRPALPARNNCLFDQKNHSLFNLEPYFPYKIVKTK